MMKNNTWNIIFLALDINDKLFTNNYDKEVDAIAIGIENFKRDVEATKFTESLNISYFEYVVKKNNEDNLLPKFAKHFSFEKGSNNLYVQPKQIEELNFNCYEIESYSAYLKSKISNQPNQKYLIIFLAHSFGGGFLMQDIKTYFSVSNFNLALDMAFDSIKIDCLFTLCCTLQSIETNIIFRNSVNLLIGAQQPMFVETINFKTLFFDLANYSTFNLDDAFFNFTDEQLFSKYILNCHREYLKSQLLKKLPAKPFILSLTKPNNSKYLMIYLNIFAAHLEAKKDDHDFNNIRFAKNFCIDPSVNHNLYIIDALQFFIKLEQFFLPENNKFKLEAINFIQSSIKKLIIYSIITGNNCDVETKTLANIRMHLPYGIGMFLSNGVSNGSTVLKTVYDDLYTLNLKNNFIPTIDEWQSVVSGVELKTSLYQKYFSENPSIAKKLKLSKTYFAMLIKFIKSFLGN